MACEKFIPGAETEYTFNLTSQDFSRTVKAGMVNFGVNSIQIKVQFLELNEITYTDN